MDGGIEDIASRGLDICARLDNAFDLIKQIDNRSSAQEFFKQMKSTKHLLEALNASHEAMCKFAKIEATAYVELVRKHLEPVNSTDRQDRIFDWLRDLSEKDQNEVIQRAGDGEPIDTQYDRFRSANRCNALGKDAYEYRDSKIEEYKNKGCVSISLDDCVKSMRYGDSKLGRKIADAFVNRTKDDLLDLGAVGIGNGQYINVSDSRFSHLVLSAIQIRVKSIINDILSLEQIVVKLEHIPECGINDFAEYDFRTGKYKNEEVTRIVIELLDILEIIKFKQAVA